MKHVIKLLKLAMILSELAIVIGFVNFFINFNGVDSIPDNILFLKQCLKVGISVYFFAKLAKWSLEE